VNNNEEVIVEVNKAQSPQEGKTWTKPEIVQLDVQFDTKSGFANNPDLNSTAS